MGTGLGRLGLTERQCWTAGYRTEEAEIRRAVAEVHLGFLRAGADVVTANTYNVSKARLQDSRLFGLPPEEAAAREAQCIRANVELARAAIAQHARETGVPFEGVLAASLGCFGTSIPGRGETANRVHADEQQAVRVPGYGVSQEALHEFHRSRALAAIGAGVRVLAFETIPDLPEARAIAALLPQLSAVRPDLEALVMFTCRDGERVDNGDRFEECCAALSRCDAAVALGVNCTEPRLVPALLAAARRAAPSKLLIAKPNSGEVYDMREPDAATLPPGERGDVIEGWKPGPDSLTAHAFGAMARRWHKECGAALVGGCCRIGHAETAAVVAACAD